jgi:hypothetical protein
MSLLTFRAQRHALLGYVHFLLALVVIHTILVPGYGPSHELFGSALAVLIAMFCVADARARGLTLPWIFGFMIMAAWPVAAPVYLFWSRGYRGLPWALLLIGSAVTTMLVAGIFALALYIALYQPPIAW